MFNVGSTDTLVPPFSAAHRYSLRMRLADSATTHCDPSVPSVRPGPDSPWHSAFDSAHQQPLQLFLRVGRASCTGPSANGQRLSGASASHSHPDSI
jgi:hypothetical protein